MMYRSLFTAILGLAATTVLALGWAEEPASDRRPATMREALRDPGAARALFADPAFDDPRSSDEQVIAAALHLRGNVARWLPVVDRWEVGWFDTDGVFVADPGHDFVDSLTQVNANPLGFVIVDGIVNGGHFPIRLAYHQDPRDIVAVHIVDDAGITMQPEDINMDGFVDHLDLDLVLANLAQKGLKLTRFDGDLNGDRIVDAWDVLFVLRKLYRL